MEDSDYSVSLSSLLCKENETCLDEEEEEEEYKTDMFISEMEDEYIEMLVLKETSFEIKSYGSSEDLSNDDNWLKCARLDAVRWILKMRAFFGFGYQTAYLSVTYFDRFLSQRSIDNGRYWGIRLLSIACLSLAAKMEECIVPLLSDFRVEEYDFENKVIQRMELMVLNVLEWRMKSITPFLYLNYFISKFSDESRPKNLLSSAVEIILATTEVMNLMDHRPSVIAAAAVLVASDRRLTKKSVDFKMGRISSCGSLENDHVFSCYNLMRELENGKLKIPKISIHQDLSSTHSSSVDVLDGTSLPSLGSKRRRIALKDCNVDCCVSGEK
ncbi:cyclin d5;1 [Tasmannia lanceolata]|uniref:cyclin d5;1 n=1 Tax=Tasmannia lanceolata TaxID=3420 RepID=UPI004063617F